MRQLSHERWWVLHSRLCDEVTDKLLWQWPIIIHPKHACIGDDAAVVRWQRFASALEESDKALATKR
jgi:hypothetical protein